MRGLWGVSFLVVLGFASPSLAQPMVPGGGVQRPTVSPYINLVRGNGGLGSAAVNYYGLVRPEIQYRQQANQFQQQLATTNQNINDLNANNGQVQTVTGKGASFQNYSHYFNNFGSGGSGRSFGVGSAGGGSSFAGITPRNNSSGFTIGSAPQSSPRGGRR